MTARWRSPTVTILFVIVAVFAVQLLLNFVRPGAAAGLFALTAPLEVAPWTIVSSVYAHTGPGHLLANAVALLVVGLVIERQTTPARFQAFFLATGAVAGVAEVLVAAVLGPTVPWIRPNVAVMGASGAIFGLVGYLLAGNWLTDRIAGRVTIPVWLQILGVVLVAAAITWTTRGTRVALVAHFTGLVIGLVAGRAHVLRP
jgi:membrane associated rhomboid family serine protease